MKLACQRCKRKKIKCDKSAPVCHQCAATNSECQYVARRQRPRLAQQRVAVQQLNQRLEMLEKQVATVDCNDQRSSTTSFSVSATPPEDSISSIPSPSVAFNTADSAQESWIYRMANVARRNFQTTPIDAPMPRIDNVMSSLNDALEDLGKLKLRADLSTSRTNLDISKEESRQCIDAFIKFMDICTVPGIGTVVLDINLLRTLPDIIDSPYVQVAPGMRVMYYNALQYGLEQTRGPQDAMSQRAYLKTLEAVPAWLDDPTETDVDGFAAALTSWAAISNSDYQLSWKFHCKSCHSIKSRGIDHLDRVPAKTLEEESRREGTRYLYWFVLSIDCLFRLFYGKPTVMRWIPNHVRPPGVLTHGNLHPSANQVMITVIWMRYTVMTAETLNFIDSALDSPDAATHPAASAISQKVDDFCTGLESLMAEFEMERQMKAPHTPDPIRCLYADHLMNIYAVIIGIKRLTNPPDAAAPVDAVTLRAARKVVSTLLEFETDPALPGPEEVFIHFISFYPFCAVFSLYTHILTSADPTDCAADLSALETIARAMTRTCSVRPNFAPFANTIAALNRVSRAIQDERLRGRGGHVQVQVQTTTQTQTGVDGGGGDGDAAEVLPALDAPVFDMAAFQELAGVGGGGDGEMDPLGYVRALENDFLTRNWHEDWWEMDGGGLESEAGLGGSGSGGDG